MLLENLICEIDAPIFESLPTLHGCEVSGITRDSRRTQKGDLYIALNGLHCDGHDYIGDAVRSGAAAIAVDSAAIKDGRVDPRSFELPVIVCKDTREAMSYLLAAWYGNPQRKLKTVGVTGTNGKTSVTRLIYEILNSADMPAGLIGTTGSRTPEGEISIRSADPLANMTTPDPEELFPILAEMLRRGCRYAVMEVTSHALAQSRVAPIIFDVAVFLNLSEDHLDLHGNMENYFSAKAKLFRQSLRAVINYDDKYGRILADNIKIPASLCSAEGREVDRAAEDVRLLSERGIEYKLSSRDLRLRVRSPLCGSFNVMNTMTAAVTAYLLGASVTDIKETLSRFSGVDGRLERVRTGRDFSLYIDYAHTPDALENLILTVRGFTQGRGRIVLLFGCGGDRDRAKRPIMGRIATSLADHVIITSDNSRSESAGGIIADILSGIESVEASYTVIESRREAIEYAIKNARSGDVILLAGKGHEEYEISDGIRTPFCEREIALEFIEKYYG